MQHTISSPNARPSAVGAPQTRLAVDQLKVCYGPFVAVHDVTFTVQSGEIFGLLGPNGAGKTSTLSAIEGLLKPASGTITVNGYPLGEKRRYAKASMGVQLQSTSFQPELTVSEIFQLFAGLYGVPLSTQALSRLLQEIKLENAGGKRFGQLSGGQQQRVSLAIATLHQPEVVLLDELTTGLDPQSRRQLWERIESLRDRGHAILLTTHSMEEAEAVCDRIAIIDHGQLVALDAPQALIDRYRNEPDVVRASRRGKITLEDVFIGLTGTAIRS